MAPDRDGTVQEMALYTSIIEPQDQRCSRIPVYQFAPVLVERTGTVLQYGTYRYTRVFSEVFTEIAEAA